MAFPICRRLFIRYIALGNSRSNLCLLSVRRNASSILPDDEPLSSEAFNSSLPGLSNPEAIQTLTALLKEYGFTDAHISKLETRIPHIYRYRPEKNLSLKFKFLESIGLSRADIPNFVLRTPYFMSSSLEQKLIPCYNYLKNLHISEEQLNRILILSPRMITANWEATIAPNLELLGGMGLPLSITTYCVTHHLAALSCNHVMFKSSVDQAIKIGLNPLRKTFIIAVHVLCGNSKETWARKMEVYRGFGLSDDEILLVFRKYPRSMSISEKKIARGLEFFLQEMNWTSATLISNPVILQFNLERRVIPRCQVVEILKKKGFLKIGKSPHFLMISEKKFVNEYIRSHEDVSSELMEIYKRRHDGSSSLSKTS